ncbi:putative RNA polymerase-associated protein RTF1-like protein [Hypsibius exemplaris]|uniref:RNA polymerase-associated protein RTF1-like protein n=1 Tax=Hypsibius exemplaris TaxID=2072580 RepID=A0A1W0WKS5_HYPEX|nr:putative RNA polymerase-associated protein RTF1-like protein [Hypsibius exemplaris]
MSSSDEDVKPDVKKESSSDDDDDDDDAKDAKKEVKTEKRSRSSSSSDDESKDEPIHSRLRAKKSKASNIYSSSSEEEISDDDKKKKGKKTAKGKKAPSKSARSSKAKPAEPDIEEGEVSEDESEDDDISDAEYKDEYDENLIGDAEDKQRLACMSERERETEIYRRLEQRQIAKRRFELEQKLRKRAANQAKKKSLTKAVDDTSARSKERRLMVEGKKDSKAKAIEDLRAAREEKKSRAAELEKKRAAVKPRKRRETESDDEEDEEEEDALLKDVKRKQVKDSSGSSSSDDDDDDDEGRPKKSKREGERDSSQDPITGCEDLEKLRLSRFRLSKWLYLPYFADLVKGFFVRVNLGDMEKNQPIYTVAEILGLGSPAKPYNVALPGEKPLMTNVTLKLGYYGKEKDITMNYVSNQVFTSTEFEEFKCRTANRQCPLPTLEHMKRKFLQSVEANKYEMTDADITKMVAQKDQLGMKPRNIVMRKAELVKMRDSALRMDAPEEARKIQQELDDLEQQTAQQDAPRQAGQTKIEAINRRNKSAAMEALGKALSSKEVKQEQVADDPFTRRWGTPMLKKDKKSAVDSAAKVEVKTEATVAAAPTAPVKADPFSNHDFHIDLNIDFSDFALPSSSFTRRTK